ncbi:carbohydrate-binding module family 20 domain-containing protein [Flexivirga oryzae]|uniref:Alpha-amylase n=1 Tax=Flexivirga oryzae TaxID=1794944 RepID=A0A839NDS4_9MICO|nr:carbohydrate-binding module family 20 domain-containing protein [Flexivirga oryzae]MBB2893776.1 alpha-amylase [Flexivirga oryzae]
MLLNNRRSRHHRSRRAGRRVGAALTTTLLAGSFACIATTASAPSAQATAPGQKNVTAVLFQWPWKSVARECTDSLGPDGYGYVQVSPPTDEPRLQDQWWTSYQPVSYNLNGKEGTRQEFAAMVQTCNDAGVKVIVDTIVNHMTGTGSAGATSIAGESFSKYNYPGLYSDNDFHSCRHDITDWSNKSEVQNCELVGLADLDTGSDYVRGKIAGYMNDLLSLGVSGFRIDAAKHVNNADLQAIKAKLTDPNVYWAQEVISDSTVPASDYYATGDVHDFAYASQLKSQFGSGQIKNLESFGTSWGILPSEHASVFVSNHDTERNGTTLSYKDGAAYTLANTFMLAFPDGSPSIQSGYSFTNTDAGPAVDSTGHVEDAVCGENGWLCVHSEQPIAGMVGFHNAVGDSAVNNWWDDGNNQIAFGRGDKGFVVINHEDGALTHTFQTSLPAGTYCDVVSTDPASDTCDSSHAVTVGADGTFTATVPAQSALAIDVAKTTTGGDSGGGSDDGTTAETFAVNATTIWGQNIYVVGNTPALGSWDTSKAVALSAATYPVWKSTVSLTSGTAVEYKYIRKNADGSVTWESGSNRTVTPSGTAASVNDTWRN